MPDLIYNLKYEVLKDQPMFYFNDYYIENNKLYLVRETALNKFTMEIDDVRDINMNFMTAIDYEDLERISTDNEAEGIEAYNNIFGLENINQFLEDIEDTIDYEDYLENIVYEYIVREETSLNNLGEYIVEVETILGDR